MDRFCFSGVGHQSCFCLRTGTPSSRMETRMGKACSNEDMSIFHSKDCWLNFYLSPPCLVLADIMATQWPSRKAGGPLAACPLWPSGMLAAGLSDVWKESLTKCWIRCLSDSGVNSLLMGTMLSFRTRIALQRGRGKAQLCQRIAAHPKLIKNATVCQITPLQLHCCSRELCLPGLTVVELIVRGMWKPQPSEGNHLPLLNTCQAECTATSPPQCCVWAALVP